MCLVWEWFLIRTVQFGVPRPLFANKKTLAAAYPK